MSSSPERDEPQLAIPVATSAAPGNTAVPTVPRAVPPDVRLPRTWFWLLVALLALAAASSGLLWQRLATIQEQLARQSADSGANAVEARTLARQAQELARETAARLAVTESRVAEVTLQRTQLEDLMQSLSRSRDENVIVDIEASLRLAQQQSQLTLSPEPLLAALRAADQRLARVAQPRLARVRTAINRDIERIKGAAVADVPGLLARIDDMTRIVDELPVANAVGPQAGPPARRQAEAAPQPWWRHAIENVREEARSLVRVSRVDNPDAALLSPEQAFFVRENVKLKLLNARLSLLARQTELARADLAAAQLLLTRYFEQGRRTGSAAQALQQLAAQLRNVETPRIDETLALLDTAAGGR